MKQRQVKAIKNVLFRFEISLKAEKFTTRFGEKRGSGEKRHAECIKTFCLTIFSFFYLWKKEKQILFYVASAWKMFFFLAKSNKLSACNLLCSLFHFLF